MKVYEPSLMDMHIGFTLDKKEWSVLRPMLLEDMFNMKPQIHRMEAIINSVKDTHLNLAGSKIPCASIHDNMKAWSKIVVSVRYSEQNKIGFLEIVFLTGMLSVTITQDEAKEYMAIGDVPEWIMFIEDEAMCYFPHGSIERGSMEHRSFKFKKKFSGWFTDQRLTRKIS